MPPSSANVLGLSRSLPPGRTVRARPLSRNWAVKSTPARIIGAPKRPADAAAADHVDGPLAGMPLSMSPEDRVTAASAVARPVSGFRLTTGQLAGQGGGAVGGGKGLEAEGHRTPPHRA